MVRQLGSGAAADNTDESDVQSYDGGCRSGGTAPLVTAGAFEVQHALAPALHQSAADVIQPFGRNSDQADACTAALVLQLMLRMHVAAVGASKSWPFGGLMLYVGYEESICGVHLA